MTEPVSLEQARMHLKLDVTGSPAAHPEDDLVSTLIAAARRYAERMTGRSLVEADLLACWDCWMPELSLSGGPVQSITAVQYVADDGTQTTLDPSLYRVDLVSAPARITPAYGEGWPYARPVTNAIQVAYVAGPGGAVPDDIITAMLLIIGGWYEQRSIAGGIPVRADELLFGNRIFWSM